MIIEQLYQYVNRVKSGEDAWLRHIMYLRNNGIKVPMTVRRVLWSDEGMEEWDSCPLKVDIIEVESLLDQAVKGSLLLLLDLYMVERASSTRIMVTFEGQLEVTLASVYEACFIFKLS